MRITKRQLRRIIKETLLREGAKEDVVAYYEQAEQYEGGDAVYDLLDRLVPADAVAMGLESLDDIEQYDMDVMEVVDMLTPEIMARIAPDLEMVTDEDMGSSSGGTTATDSTWLISKDKDRQGKEDRIFDGVPVWDEIPDNRMGNKVWVIKGTAQLAKEIFGDVTVYDLGDEEGIRIEPGSANVEALRAEWEPLWPDAQVTNNTINITSDSAYAAADKVID
jgi:hypothetical protein